MAEKKGLAAKGIVARTAARLKKKLGPAPIWVWVAVVLLGGVYYLRHRAASATAPVAASTAPVDTGAAASTGDDTGAGAGGGGSVTPSPPIPLATAPASWDPGQTGDPNPIAPQTPGQGTALTSPDASPPAAPSGAKTRTSAPAAPSRTSQPLLAAAVGTPGTVSEAIPGRGIVGVTPLSWGGQSFTTQSQFAAWAKSKGSSVANELKNHPQAATIYEQLGPSPYAAATVARPAVAPAPTPVAQPRALAAAAPARTTGGAPTNPNPAPRQASAPTAEPLHVVAVAQPSAGAGGRGGTATPS